MCGKMVQRRASAERAGSLAVSTPPMGHVSTGRSWETSLPTGNSQAPWGAVDAGRQSSHTVQKECSGVVWARPLSLCLPQPRGQHLAVASETKGLEEQHLRP